MLAGRLSDKMSSELGIALFGVVPGDFVFRGYSAFGRYGSYHNPLYDKKTDKKEISK